METLDKLQAGIIKSTVYLESLVDFLSSVINTDKYLEILEKLRKTNKSDELLVYFTVIFDKIDLIKTTLNTLVNVVISPENHSDTFRAEAKTLSAKTTAKLNAFFADVKAIEPNLIPEISNVVLDTINKSTDKLAIIDDLRSKYHKYPSLIKVYAMVMQRAIDTLDRSITYKLLEYIAEDKESVLSSAIPKTKQLKLPNPPLSRFNLLPMTKTMPLKELIPLVFVEDKIISETSLKAIARKISAGIIIITSVTYTPVEYDIRPLVVDEAAKEYIQPSAFGVNKKIVDRFKTVETLTPSPKWEFNIEVLNEDADKFYVLESLDGKNYRCMAPWVTSNTYLIARFRLTKLLNYSHNPSLATKYHVLATQQATKNMFLDKALNIDDFDSKLTEVESGQIQNDIISSVLKVITEIVKKDYGSKITSSNDVSDILHNAKLIDAFLQESVYQSKNKLDGGKFKSGDILSSFIIALQTATRRFARELHNSYTREPLKAAEFTGNKAADLALAMKKITTVVQRSVELVVKLNDNLFTANYYKYLILNYAV